MNDRAGAVLELGGPVLRQRIEVVPGALAILAANPDLTVDAGRVMPDSQAVGI